MGDTSSLLVLDGPEEVEALAAEIVANRLRGRPRLRMLIPTGHTPLGMYSKLRDQAATGRLRSEQATVFQLDEYRGLDATDPRSYRSYLRRELGGIEFAVRHELDANAPDPVVECSRYQALLDDSPIDLAVLGLGRDGHVAFDEPGSLLEEGVHQVDLHPTTREDAAADFGGAANVPARALTVGLSTLHAARELLVLVTGETKAEALNAMLEQRPSSQCPASLLRIHPRMTVLCDRAAASQLRPSADWESDHLVVVLGHREPGVSAEHRISKESLDRLQQAERIAYRERARAIVLTGYSSTGGLTEAEQMWQAWSMPGIPAVLEMAGRNTVENATCSLPLIMAMGGIRRVSVVTSRWHLRAPYFFAPYRDLGLELSFRYARLHGPWLRMIATELFGLRRSRGERRRAYAAARPPREHERP